jgi:uncharacterized repeat protein (TIGR01451 family)
MDSGLRPTAKVGPKFPARTLGVLAGSITTKRRLLVLITSMLVVGAVLAPGTPAFAAADPSGVSFTIEGCRNNGTITLPNGDGKFICPDAAYTTGNLGKGWNELDLVPFRVTADAGNSAPATQTYAMDVALDSKDAGKPGYDVLSAPELNTTLSSNGGADCSISVGAEQTATPGIGGIDETRYRTLTITQPKSSTCVYDYYGRLALGSHLFPGSSLHADLANQSLGTAGIGAKDVSIPVKEILPQELSKDMSATQGSDHAWDITKSPTPAHVDFPNSCDPEAANSAGVSITVTWTKLAATPNGPITVITHVYATNPASRVVTVTAHDDIQSGATVLEHIDGSAIDVPANTSGFLVLTHQTTVPAGTTDLNDVATATYTDKVTGIPVPGSTQATASAPVDFSGPELNQSATINDTESVTGSGFTFSTDSFDPQIGHFDGNYVAGMPTVGPVSWTSDSQSDSGSVTFQKTIYVATGTDGTGTLSDVATLTGSDGFTNSANGAVSISSTRLADLTIHKTIPDVIKDGDAPQTFTFDVKDGDGNVVDTVQITFNAGETDKSVDVPGLTPGTYAVSEHKLVGWSAQADRSVDLGTSCGGTAEFKNTPVPPGIDLDKKVKVNTGSFTDGPTSAYVGDTLTYEVTVKNTGETPLALTWGDQLSSTFVDAKCDPGTISGPTGDANSDGKLDTTETWTFTCTHKVTASDADPLVNTVKVTGTDSFHQTVSDHDSTSVDIRHPAIAIDKTGPATANAGDLVPFTIVITDTGDTSYSEPDVHLTDALCQAPPSLVTKNGDSSPGTFDPGDKWTYTCSVQTQAGQTSIHNVALVNATDVGAKAETATDDASTVLAAQVVSPIRVGSAKLRGTQGCAARNRATASVAGKEIAFVTFYVDGKKVKVVRKPVGGRYTLSVDARKLEKGAHKVKAVVTFNSGVTPKKRTLSLTFFRCAAAKPKFTG